MTQPTPTDEPVLIELEDTFDDASLEMNAAGNGFRVATALQDLVDDTAAGLAAHAGTGAAAHALATPSVAGFMSAADKAKLDAAPAGGNSGSIWAPPSVAHALDDEFTAPTLNPAWLTYVIPSGGALEAVTFDFATPINIFSPPASGTARASLSRRPGWLQIQPGRYEGAGGWQGDYQLIKPLGVVPTNMAFYARINTNWPTNPHSSACGFRLCGGTPGSPTLQDSVRIELSLSNGAYQVLYGGTNGGGGISNLLTLVGQGFVTGPLEPVFVGIQKMGNDYWAFFGNDGGSSVLLASKWTTAVAMTHVGFYCRGYGNAADEGKCLYSVDFTRFANNVVLPL